MAREPLVGQGLLIIKASLSNSAGLAKLSRTPLHEWSARRRDLYLTTHNTHMRQTFMPSARFERAIPASKLPQTHALECAATVICLHLLSYGLKSTSGTSGWEWSSVRCFCSASRGESCSYRKQSSVLHYPILKSIFTFLYVEPEYSQKVYVYLILRNCQVNP